MRTRWTLPMAMALVGLVGAGAVQAGEVTSYADAKALAASSNKALLLDFYTQW